MNKNLIEELTNAFGPSGFEHDVVRVIYNNCKELGLDVDTDCMLNVYTKHKHYDNKKPVIMLDAHTDEIGFMVQYINEKGLIGFINIDRGIIYLYIIIKNKG